ncbi:MAG: AraC family transcriptional regulator ligand-binding domain-containing protein, partial [Nevskiales bacterium]
AKSFQVLGYSAMSCRTLAGAIERLQRYEKLVWDVGVSELDIEDGTAVLKLVPEGVSMVPEQVIEMSISGWVHFGRRIMREPAGLTEVRFRHARIGPQARYEEILGCPVKFDQPFTEIRFPERMLDAPLMGADPSLLALMDQQGGKLLAEFARETNLVNETRAAICGLLKEGEPELASVAARLDMTPRILRRRLSGAGTNFQSLVDGVRRDLALSYIHNTEMSLLDIAFMLGFSDQSAFNRAFKRWTGQAPGRYKASAAATGTATHLDPPPS